MGVSHLFSLVRELVPELMQRVSFLSLKGKRVAIELSSLMYRMAYSRTSSKDESFLLSILDLHDALRLMCPRVLFVFDADRTPDAVEATVRDKKLVNMKKHFQRLFEAKQGTQYKRIVESDNRITAHYFVRLRKLMDTFDVEYIVAPLGIEAEWLAVQYQHHNEIDVVITTDSDSIACGSPCVFTQTPQLAVCCKLAGFFVRKMKNGTPVAFDIALESCKEENKCVCMSALSVCSSFKISMGQLVHACVMSGTDHWPSGFKNIGMHKAIELMREHNTIQNWISSVRDKRSCTSLEQAALDLYDAYKIQTALIAFAPNEAVYRYCISF